MDEDRTFEADDVILMRNGTFRFVCVVTLAPGDPHVGLRPVGGGRLRYFWTSTLNRLVEAGDALIVPGGMHADADAAAPRAGPRTKGRPTRRGGARDDAHRSAARLSGVATGRRGS